ncbi:MAG: HupE/UreJ family protein [Myxococcales bacterium]|nr:HupE/UreJ family protein [Myxococcales bacterium]
MLLVLGLVPSARAHPAGFGLLTADVGATGEVDVALRVSGSPDRALAIELVGPDGCEPRAPATTRTQRTAVERHWHLRCPTPLRGALGLRNLPVDLQVRLEVRGEGEAQGATLHAGQPTYALSGAPDDAFARYLALGVEHIAFGVDHLLFVLGLVLLVRRWRALVVTITAFTLGHSVTLALASLGWVAIPIAPVEACIALSILVLAHELARPRVDALGSPTGDAKSSASPTVPTLTGRYPALIAAAFGLLHGLGFAGALAEVGLPAGGLVSALFAFNLGVELGQLAFVALGVLGLLALRGRDTLDRGVTRALAYGLGSVAAFWTLERTVAVLVGS